MTVERRFDLIGTRAKMYISGAAAELPIGDER
jgi:hypothetical protein